MRDRIARARRTAAIAAGITTLLIAVKSLVGAIAGSAALLADAVHSGSDLLAIITSWFGLHIASREPTKRFPYGFYRAETFAALVASGIILYLGGTLLWQGIKKLTIVPSLSHPAMAISTAIVAAGVALALSSWEKRVSRETGSQSLKATADETRLDAGTSMLVFAALLAAHSGLPVFEGVVTILISGLVLWAGLKNARSSVLSLMDASVDPDLEREIADVLSEMPEVNCVERLRARRSGPFYFVEGHVHVAGCMDVTRSHALTHEAQRAIRERRPEVEGVILHVEPRKEKVRRVVLPVKNAEGVSAALETHFGRAKWFLIATIEGDRMVSHTIEKNPFQTKEVRAGLAAINWLVKEKEINAAVVREIGEISYHTLRDNYVEVFRAPGGVARDALHGYDAGDLSYLSAPTHSSEIKVEQKDERPDEEIRENVKEKLSKVIDPETGMDVLSMGLIKDVVVRDGKVSLNFRPSSPVCPLAFKLGSDIRETVQAVPGVQDLKIKVENFNRADELESLLRD